MRKIDISRKIKLRIEFFLNRRNQWCLLISFFRLLTCFRRKFAIVTTNQRPKPVEREKERGRGGRKLIVSFLWLEYESRIRVENVGEGRWRREQERENREYIGPGLDRLHPCHLPERGYVFSTCSIETESWIQRIGTVPEDTLVVRASADFVPFTFLCLLWSKYTPCKLVWRKIDI